MGAKLTFKYDRAADILHIDKCAPYPEQESEELGDEVIARLNPQTGEVENLEVLFFRPGCCAASCSNCRCRPNCVSRLPKGMIRCPPDRRNDGRVVYGPLEQVVFEISRRTIKTN
jgi:uncharacterized protein YuzE